MPAVELSSPPLSKLPVPVPVVERVPAVDLRSSPLSGQSSPVSSQTLAWGDAGDSSVSLSSNRVQAGHSQDVPVEGSLFHVSPVSPGFLFRPSRAAQQLPPDGVLLPTTLNDFSYSVLGDLITFAQCEQILGSDSPMSLLVYALPSGSAYLPGQSSVPTVSASGTSSRPEVGSSAVAPPMDMEDSPLSVSVHVVQWTAVLGWESSVWLAASSPAVPGVRRCAGVGSTIVPFINVLGGSAWRGTSDDSCGKVHVGHGPVAPSDGSG